MKPIVITWGAILGALGAAAGLRLAAWFGWAS